MNQQTTTAVHDAPSRAAQQREEQARGVALQLGLGLGAQALALGVLTLLPAAVTASWWAALLQLAPMGALYLLGRLARRGLKNGEDPLPVRVALGGFALLFLSDMALDLFTLVELTHVFILPKAPRAALALAAAASACLAAPGGEGAAPRIARFLRLFLLAGFVFCAVTVLPTGEAGFLYPVAGRGVGYTLRRALPMTGAVWSAAALPLLTEKADGRALLPAVRCTLLAGLFFFICAYVLPATALGADWGYALRLQLLMEMSPNTLSWSLMLLAQLFLFLTAFSAAGSFLTHCARRALRAGRVPLPPFALLCALPAILGIGQGSALLERVLPWRAAAAAGLLLLCLAAQVKRRKNA